MAAAASGSAGVHPGAVLPEIDDLQQVGVKAAFQEQPPEGGFVELGGAGRQHHPVQGKVLDILLYFLLARLGAGIEMMAADRHPGQILGCRGQGFGVQDPGDVEAAVADIEADAGFFGHMSYQLSAFSFRRNNAKDYSRLPSLA